MNCKKLKEECGIFGVKAFSTEAAGITYNALLALQHRGQEGAGIAVLKDSSILYHKNLGLVSEVFTGDVLAKLPKARMAIGHVRYSNAGCSSKDDVQPIVKEYLKGRIAVAHNGAIVNVDELRTTLKNEGCDFPASNDGDLISSLIAFEALKCDEIEEAIKNAVKKLKGAFSLVILTSKKKIVAVRDPWGFRPLCIGKNENGVVVASESCAVESGGFKFIRDLEPGEMIVIDEFGNISSEIIMKEEKQGLCIFEYVYFARTDSVIDGLSVYDARFNAGIELAKEYPVDADIVCGVPDSGIEAAMGYAYQSGIPFVPGFVKNRYIGRSFIYPTQTQRETAVRIKLNPLRTNVEGKRIVLVDDSIVRGTTSKKIIMGLKAAGAKEVHLRISSPPFKHVCYFGTDIDSEDKLIANFFNVNQIADQIGADSLGYISEKGLIKACGNCNMKFCTGCFDNDYPIDVKAILNSNNGK